MSIHELQEVQVQPSDVEVPIECGGADASLAAAAETDPHLPAPIHLRQDLQHSISRHSGEQVTHTLIDQGHAQFPQMTVSELDVQKGDPDFRTGTSGNVLEGRISMRKKKWYSRLARRVKKML